MVKLVNTRKKPNDLLIQASNQNIHTKAKITTLYALEKELRNAIIFEGICFLTNKNIELDTIAFEIMLHTFYLNTVYRVYPRISTKSPFRKEHLPTDLEHTLNSFQNIGCINRVGELISLKNIAVNIPAIIALPGPSFDISWIKKMSKKCLIVAVGRILPKLLEGGIVPDILYMQDTSAYAWSYTCQNIRKKLSTIVIANPVSPIHAYIDKFQFIYKSWNYYPFETISYPSLECIAPSSASGAYSATRYLGCNPVIFSGCDCCKESTNDNIRTISSLASNSNAPGFKEYCLDDVKPLVIQIPGGNKIETKSEYIAAAQWIKMNALRDKILYNLQTFDNSSSGFLRFNSVIKNTCHFSEPETSKIALPEIQNNYHIEEYKKFLIQIFSDIKDMFLKNRELHKYAKKAPFNCIFHNLKNVPNSYEKIPKIEIEKSLEIIDKCISVITQEKNITKDFKK